MNYGRINCYIFDYKHCGLDISRMVFYQAWEEMA